MVTFPQMLNFSPINFSYDSNFLLEEKLMFRITLANAKGAQESEQTHDYLTNILF